MINPSELRLNFKLKNFKLVILVVLLASVLIILVIKKLNYDSNQQIKGESVAHFPRVDQSTDSAKDATPSPKVDKSPAGFQNLLKPSPSPTTVVGISEKSEPLEPLIGKVEFDVTLKDYTSNSNSDISFQINYLDGADSIKVYEITIPGGWEISDGKNFGPGELMGEGKLITGGRVQRDITISNIQNTSNQMGLRISFKNPAYAQITFDTDIIKQSDGSYKWIINRDPFIALATPIQINFTLFGQSSSGRSIFKNPQIGEYKFRLDSTFLDNSNNAIEKEIEII